MTGHADRDVTRTALKSKSPPIADKSEGGAIVQPLRLFPDKPGPA
jgi:hypothetical protein